MAQAGGRGLTPIPGNVVYHATGESRNAAQSYTAPAPRVKQALRGVCEKLKQFDY